MTVSIPGGAGSRFEGSLGGSLRAGQGCPIVAGGGEIRRTQTRADRRFNLCVLFGAATVY